MVFNVSRKVLFKDCDPAGIVFFPRYFEMISDVTEAFFETALDVPYPELLKTHGVPTVQIEASFPAPSHHGDILQILVVCETVGRTSLRLGLTATCAGQTRFSAKSTLVYVNKAGKPQPWPDTLRAALRAHMQGDH